MTISKRVFPREAVLRARALLALRYPACFVASSDPAPKLPLKIDIHKDLFLGCPELPKALIKTVLANYTRGPKYTKCMTAGSMRVDLLGHPTTMVTESDMDNAQFRERKRLEQEGEAKRERATMKKIVAEVQAGR